MTIVDFEVLDPAVGRRIAGFSVDFGGGITVRGFAVIERRDGSRFVGMPAWRIVTGGYRDVVVLADDLYAAINTAALTEYERLAGS